MRTDVRGTGYTPSCRYANRETSGQGGGGVSGGPWRWHRPRMLFPRGAYHSFSRHLAFQTMSGLTRAWEPHFRVQDSLGTDSRWCSLLFEPSSRRLFENVRYAGLSHVCVRSGRDGSERGGLRLAAGGSIEREGVGKLVSKGRARRHCGLMDGGKDKRSDLGWPLLLQLTKDRRPSCECEWVDWYKSLQCFRQIASVSHPVRRWRIPACSIMVPYAGVAYRH